jgi:Sec-independent protein translocase protein TatA
VFGISLPEIAIICLVALIAVGPDKLPDAARSIAKLLAQFRRGSDELRRDFYNSLYPPLPPAEPTKFELNESPDDDQEVAESNELLGDSNQLSSEDTSKPDKQDEQ